MAAPLTKRSRGGRDGVAGTGIAALRSQ